MKDSESTSGEVRLERTVRRGVTLRGAAANNFIAELLVDQYGVKARENTCGPMLRDINAILKARGIA